MRDLKLAFRMLFRSPFVTTVAILSLALGIGANAAVFSLFDQLLLRPLPVPAPDRLVNVSAPGPKPGSISCNTAGECTEVLSYPMYRDLERAATEQVRLAGHRSFQVNAGYGGETVNGEGLLVSGSYFPVLGIRPLRGRLLTAADDAAPGAHFVAVLGHAFWQARLGSDPRVVGSAIIVNGQPFTIVGIAPPGFEGTTTGVRPMVYVPLSMRGVVNARWDGFENRRSYWVYAFGRLQPGVGRAQAQAALNGPFTRLIQEVEAPLQTGMSDQAMAQFRQKTILLRDGRRGQSSVHEEARVPLILLFATAAMVLLIACANIANLLLARGASRDMEMAVRLSLGASRRSVVRQLLAESLVLALMGGVASIVVAKWTLSGIGALMPAQALDSIRLELQAPMVVFAALLTFLTGLLFGLFPALHSTRPDLVSTIRANAGNLTGSRTAARFRATLATAQIALSMMLLICAGLFLRSLTNVGREELGLRTDDVVTFMLAPERNGYTSERSRILFERLEQELAAVPGVRSVSTAYVPILAGNNWTNDVSVEGYERAPDSDVNARFNAIGVGYFATLGIPLLAGREFTAADASATARTAIVNQAFAAKFNLGRDVIGRRMATGNTGELDIEIVGLVKDAKYSEVKEAGGAQYFTPWRQDGDLGTLTFYVHTGGATAPLLRQVPGMVARLDPNLPVEELKTLSQQVRDNVFLDRLISTLASAFAVLATLLAAVGLYGVIAYTVARRTREIGVRMALGATGGQVRRLVLRQVGVMLLVGGIIGVVAALQLGRGASAILFGLSASDPAIITLAVLTLSGFALAAGLLPARRAARIDPMLALRQD